MYGKADIQTLIAAVEQAGYHATQQGIDFKTEPLTHSAQSQPESLAAAPNTVPATNVALATSTVSDTNTVLPTNTALPTNTTSTTSTADTASATSTAPVINPLPVTESVAQPAASEGERFSYY